MKAAPLVFEVSDPVVDRPRRSVANVEVEASEDAVTGVARVALWGPLLDRLGVVDEVDRRNLRPIGPGGYSGGECYRAVVDWQLAGGDVLSDRSLLADEATTRLRGRRRRAGLGGGILPVSLRRVGPAPHRAPPAARRRRPRTSHPPSKGDFGLDHAPFANFFGNWLWWHAAALASNTARWLRVLALPDEVHRSRGKRLRLAYRNVAARVVRSGRTRTLRLPRAYAHADALAAPGWKIRIRRPPDRCASPVS